MRKYQFVNLLLLLLVCSCSLYRSQFGSFYAIRSSSKALTEQAIISLIQDGTLQTQATVFRRLIEREATLNGHKVADTWVDDTHFVVYRNRKNFVVFHPPNRTFYGLNLANCGTPLSEPEGLIGPNCDLIVHSIDFLQSDSTLHSIGWEAAGPALAEFKKSILPIIRQRAKAMEKKY